MQVSFINERRYFQTLHGAPIAIDVAWRPIPLLSLYLTIWLKKYS